LTTIFRTGKRVSNMNINNTIKQSETDPIFTCKHCGAPINPHNPTCSYCGCYWTDKDIRRVLPEIGTYIQQHTEKITIPYKDCRINLSYVPVGDNILSNVYLVAKDGSISVKFSRGRHYEVDGNRIVVGKEILSHTGEQLFVVYDMEITIIEG
jgi:predicted amidophosphoribosyltransferase